MRKKYFIKNSVRHERLKRRVTQQEFATILNVSRQTVVKLEKGDYTPSLLLALDISRYFNEPVENLFFIDRLH